MKRSFGIALLSSAAIALLWPTVPSAAALEDPDLGAKDGWAGASQTSFEDEGENQLDGWVGTSPVKSESFSTVARDGWVAAGALRMQNQLAQLDGWVRAGAPVPSEEIQAAEAPIPPPDDGGGSISIEAFVIGGAILTFLAAAVAGALAVRHHRHPRVA